MKGIKKSHGPIYKSLKPFVGIYKKNIKRPDGGEGLVQGGVPFQELLDSHWIFEKGPTNQLFLLGKKKKKQFTRSRVSSSRNNSQKVTPSYHTRTYWR